MRIRVKHEKTEVLNEDEIEELGLPKFQWATDFIDPETGMYYRGVEYREDGPNQIARVGYRKVTTTYVLEEIQEDGSVEEVDKEEEEVRYEPYFGSLGGWLDRLENLSQRGKCWVEPDAEIRGNAFVEGDVVIESCKYNGVKNGVMGNAHVTGSVKIKGKCVVTGNAYIGGDAEINCTSDGPAPHVAVSGSATVFGKVFGTGSVTGNAYVGADAEVGGTTVGGNAQVYGKAVASGSDKGRNYIQGNAIVYGEVGGINNTVEGEAVIEETGYVGGEKNYVGSGAIVAGRIEGKNNIMYAGRPYLMEKGMLRDDNTLMENAIVEGLLEKGVMVYGNARVRSDRHLDGGRISGNIDVGDEGDPLEKDAMKTYLDGSGRVIDGDLSGQCSGPVYIDGGNVKGATFEGCLLVTGSFVGEEKNGKVSPGDAVKGTGSLIVNGSVEKGEIGGGVLVCDYGYVQAAKAIGGVAIGGRVTEGTITGNPLILKDGIVEGGTVSGNARLAGMSEGSVGGNALILTKTTKRAYGNSVILADDYGDNNEVVKEEDGDREPQGAAVVVKVTAEDESGETGAEDESGETGEEGETPSTSGGGTSPSPSTAD